MLTLGWVLSQPPSRRKVLMGLEVRHNRLTHILYTPDYLRLMTTRLTGIWGERVKRQFRERERRQGGAWAGGSLSFTQIRFRNLGKRDVWWKSTGRKSRAGRIGPNLLPQVSRGSLGRSRERGWEWGGGACAHHPPDAQTTGRRWPLGHTGTPRPFWSFFMCVYLSVWGESMQSASIIWFKSLIITIFHHCKDYQIYSDRWHFL